MHVVTLKSKRKKKRNQNTHKNLQVFFVSPTLDIIGATDFARRLRGLLETSRPKKPRRTRTSCNVMVVQRWSTTCLVSTAPVSGRDARGHSDADPPGRINSTTNTLSAVFAQALPAKRYSWRNAHGIHSNFKTWMLCVVKFLVAASLCKDWVTYALPALVGFLLQNRSLHGCASQCHGCPNSTLGKKQGWKL